MSEKIEIAETAHKIIADLNSEKDQLVAAIQSMESKIDGLRSKAADIESAISFLVDTYRLKPRMTDRGAETNGSSEADRWRTGPT